MLAGTGNRSRGWLRFGGPERGRRCGLAAEGSADALFEVCERGGARADGDGVEPVKLRHGFSLVLVAHGDLADVVLPVEVHVTADAAGVRTHGDGGVPVVGVKMDDETAFGDVVVDALGFGADLTYLVVGAPGEGIVAPGPFHVDLFLEGRLDLDGEAVSTQLLG
ncbi:hypothetical protein ACE1OC_06770 [Streptomyces sp. DSM 116496]|uniref:hypothetical protein n=1 Tax=Streptomyces stoeckheimensis TaxID=3344656 RepID=UPI0038B38C9E